VPPPVHQPRTLPKGAAYHHTNQVEEQWVLRLPAHLANSVERARSRAMEQGGADYRRRNAEPPNTEKWLSIRYMPDLGERAFIVIVHTPEHADKLYPATLRDLPTRAETHKTLNGSALFKVADVAQVMVVEEKPFPGGIPAPGFHPAFDDPCLPDGLSAPTRNIVRRRFKKARDKLGKPYNRELIKKTEELLCDLMEDGGNEISVEVDQDWEEYMEDWGEEQTVDVIPEDVAVMSVMIARAMVRAKIGGGAEDDQLESSEDEGPLAMGPEDNDMMMGGDGSSFGGGGGGSGAGGGGMSPQPQHTAALAVDEAFEWLESSRGDMVIEAIMNDGFGFGEGLDSFDLNGAVGGAGSVGGAGDGEEDDMDDDEFGDEEGGLLFKGFDDSIPAAPSDDEEDDDFDDAEGDFGESDEEVSTPAEPAVMAPKAPAEGQTANVGVVGGGGDSDGSDLDIDDDNSDLDDFSDEDDEGGAAAAPASGAGAAGATGKHKAEIEELEKKIAEKNKEIKKVKAKALKKRLKVERKKLLERKAALVKDGGA
jgi:TATA-binding protein-associated factor Taf7